MRRAHPIRPASSGFVLILVTVGLAALTLAAGIGAAVINHSNNIHTVNVLTDPNATASQLESVTEQQVTNVRNELPNSANLLSNFSSLGTAPLGEGKSTAEVAGSAIAQVAVGTVEPVVIDYMSNPGSTWNANGGRDRPTEGTRPTGGKLPQDPVDGGGGGPDLATCPTYSLTVGYCGGEGGCPGPGACPCASGSEFCCIPGFCYTRDIAGCQQETCPPGVGRHYNDTCACDAPNRAVYETCRTGLMLRCDPP